METYSATDVADRCAVSYRRLDYWARTGYLVPSVPAAGSGSRRRYSAADLAKVRMTRKLLNAGVAWEQLRRDGNPVVTARRVHRRLTPIVEAAA